jgi:ACS family hexuronate transporter-like MFS transporter
VQAAHYLGVRLGVRHHRTGVLVLPVLAAAVLEPAISAGISLDQIGLPLIVIYLSADIGGILGGAFSGFLIARGMVPVKARLLCMLIFATCITSIFIASRAGSLWTAVFAISLALGAHEAWTSNIYSVLTDVTPKPMVASVFGFGSMVARERHVHDQFVGYVLTTTHNNYGVLFAIIPCTYFVARVDFPGGARSRGGSGTRGFLML